MKILLDTHVLLWWLDDPDQLSASGRDAIADPLNEALVSAASAWEIAIKRKLGKLSAPDDLASAVDQSGFSVLPVVLSHAAATESLPLLHRDPFDRMLVAQAIVEGCVIVTRDSQFLAYGVSVIQG